MGSRSITSPCSGGCSASHRCWLTRPGPCRHAVGDRWYVDETYVKVAGRWRYVYRAIDQHGQIIDVYVSPRRDTAGRATVLRDRARSLTASRRRW